MSEEAPIQRNLAPAYGVVNVRLAIENLSASSEIQRPNIIPHRPCHLPLAPPYSHSLLPSLNKPMHTNHSPYATTSAAMSFRVHRSGVEESRCPRE